MFSYQRNLTWLRWVAALKWFDPLLPFYAIYMLFFGLSYTQLFLLQIIFAIAIVLFEIPMGIYADLYGRKNSLIVGCVSLLGAITFLLFAPGFTGFMFFEIGTALFSSSFSGSDTALLYESTKQLNQTDIYLKKEAEMQAYGRYSEGVSGIFGGVFATFSVILPAIVSWLAVFPLFGITLLLKESKEINSNDNNERFLSRVKSKIHDQWHYIKQHTMGSHNREIRLIILYSGLISATTINIFWLLQVFLKDYHVKWVLIGLFWFIYHSASGLASRFTPLLLKHYGEKNIFITVPLILQSMVLILGVTHSVVWVPVLLFSAISIGIKMPFIYNLLNARLADRARASIISFDSLSARVLFSGIALMIGILLDHYSLNMAFLFLTVPIIAALILALKLIKEVI